MLVALRTIARSGAERYRHHPDRLTWQEFKMSQEGITMILLGLEHGPLICLGPSGATRVCLGMLEGFLPAYLEFFPGDVQYSRAIQNEYRRLEGRKPRRTLRNPPTCGGLLGSMVNSFEFAMGMTESALDREDFINALDKVVRAWGWYRLAKDLPEDAAGLLEGIPPWGHTPSVVVAYEKWGEVLAMVDRFMPDDRRNQPSLPVAGLHWPTGWQCTPEL